MSLQIKPFMRLCIFALILILTCSVTSNAQWENSYRPLKLHSASSTELIESLKKQLQLELNSMAYAPNFEIVKRINITRTDAIVKMVKRGEFIHDDSLESYVNNVLKQLIKNNEIEDYPKRVLILNSPTVNAFCYGQGIYIVTVSLLGRISNEHQLAFILAHELSHDVLGHIKSRISREAEIDFNRRSKEQVKKIFNGTLEAEDIQAYKKLIYDFTKYTRQKELQADSMGLSMMSGADYNEEDAYATLDILDSALKPKENIGVELFLPLHSKEYPLQDFWFNDRLSIFSRKPEDTYLYSMDSLESHPDINFRKKQLLSYVGGASGNDDHHSTKYVYAITTTAEFQTVESAYRQGTYDRCLYYALQLLNRYPENAYLISRIGKIFLDLHTIKSHNIPAFDNLVSRYTPYYTEELTLINNLLHNLTAKELGEVGYYFLSNSKNFNPSEKSHYYLLWKLSDLTYRNEMREKFKHDYKSTFGESITVFVYK